MKYEEWYGKHVLKDSGWRSIIGVKTNDGLVIENIKGHLLERGTERVVSVDAVADALKNPLHVTGVKYDKNNKSSVQYIGEHATVAVNPETQTVLTTCKTGKARVKKYKGGAGHDNKI